MSTKTKTKWRLSNLPTPLDVTELVAAGIITKEEAREMLISQETDEDRDKKSLQGEIKFLRELVQKLSENRKTEIIRQIEVIEKPYRRYDWYQPYQYYCTAGNTMITMNSGSSALNSTASNMTNAIGTVSYSTTGTADTSDFTAIKTF